LNILTAKKRAGQREFHQPSSSFESRWNCSRRRLVGGDLRGKLKRERRLSFNGYSLEQNKCAICANQ